jgi:hypothetical protein
MRTRYENGYKEKIRYWGKEYGKALEGGDAVRLEYVMTKLNYFHGRHWAWLEDNRVAKKVEKKLGKNLEL